MRILTVFGTRPEAIKLGPVIRELSKHPDLATSKVCVTSQHQNMLDQVLTLFGIVPDCNLNVMRHNQTPAQVVSAVLSRLEPILQVESPDWLLVQGDTSTVTAASLAAFHADIRIGHVEAGLRTYRKRQPFPEEINRRIVSLVADLHFAPSEQARQNLLREGISDDCIVVVGNPVIDALHWVMSLPFAATKLPVTCRELQQPDTKIILVTAHRRENMGQPLENICLSLRDIASRYENHVRIVFPVHLNPNVRKTVHRLLEGVPSITTTQPLDYQSLVHLMSRSYLVLTDSGGIQEEASAIGKPVLVLREVTERTEVVEAGIARMVGTDRGQITAETVRLLENADAYRQMARATTLYGDGHAAKRIVLALLGENG